MSTRGRLLGSFFSSFRISQNKNRNELTLNTLYIVHINNRNDQTLSKKSTNGMPRFIHLYE